MTIRNHTIGGVNIEEIGTLVLTPEQFREVIFEMGKTIKSPHTEKLMVRLLTQLSTMGKSIGSGALPTRIARLKPLLMRDLHRVHESRGDLIDPATLLVVAGYESLHSQWNGSLINRS